MPDVSLDLLQQMVQRVLDGQDMLRQDVRNVRRRMSRIEHSLTSLQHSVATLQHTDADRGEAETEFQDQIDRLATRLERLEGHAT